MERLQFTCRLGDEQADFVVPGVKAKSDGPTVFAPQAAMGAQNQEFRIEKARRLPAHSGALGQTEQVSRRLIEQHFRGDRQLARRTRRMRVDAEYAVAGRFQNRFKRDGSLSSSVHRSSIGVASGQIGNGPSAPSSFFDGRLGFRPQRQFKHVRLGDRRLVDRVFQRILERL